MTCTVEATTFCGVEAWRLGGPRGSQAVVSRRGGQVLSWITRDGRERLFLSPRAVTDGSAPIRGGIPVYFPHFAGRGPLPKHGLLRTRLWELGDSRTGDDFAFLTLVAEDDAASRAVWPHRFRVELSVLLEADRLDVELAIENPGADPWAFTAALHTYLRVVQVEDVALEGLRGLVFEDCLGGGNRRETGVELIFEEEIDRVYRGLARPLLLRAGNLSLGIHGEGFPDVVVWNPWQEKCAAMADMETASWRHMLCVEPAAAAQAVEVPAGGNWTARQTLVAL